MVDPFRSRRRREGNPLYCSRYHELTRPVRCLRSVPARPQRSTGASRCCTRYTPLDRSKGIQSARSNTRSHPARRDFQRYVGPASQLASQFSVTTLPSRNHVRTRNSSARRCGDPPQRLLESDQHKRRLRTVHCLRHIVSVCFRCESLVQPNHIRVGPVTCFSPAEFHPAQIGARQAGPAVRSGSLHLPHEDREPGL